MKTTLHGKAAESNPSASSGTTSTPDTHRSGGIHPKYKAFLEKQTCELSRQEGHVGSLCPDKAFSDEEKAACKTAFKKQKRKLK